jgi:hypothetical protein
MNIKNILWKSILTRPDVQKELDDLRRPRCYGKNPEASGDIDFKVTIEVTYQNRCVPPKTQTRSYAASTTISRSCIFVPEEQVPTFEKLNYVPLVPAGLEPEPDKSK